MSRPRRLLLAQRDRIARAIDQSGGIDDSFAAPAGLAPRREAAVRLPEADAALRAQLGG